MLFKPNVCSRSQVAYLTGPGRAQHMIQIPAQIPERSHIFSENTVLTPSKNAPGLNAGMCPSSFSFSPLEWEHFLANSPIQLTPKRKWAPQCNYIIALIGEFWEAFCWTQPSSAPACSLFCSSFPLVYFEHRKPQRLLLWLHIWFGIKMIHCVGLNLTCVRPINLGLNNISRYFSIGFPHPNRHLFH